MFRVSIGDDALCLVAECELGVAEERVVGGGDEPTCHLQNGIGGAGLDPCGEFLGLGFEFGAEWFRHRDLLPKEIPAVAQSYTELNTVPTNFRDAYPEITSRPECR
jgi:hypothetical protein